NGYKAGAVRAGERGAREVLAALCSRPHAGQGAERQPPRRALRAHPAREVPRLAARRRLPPARARPARVRRPLQPRATPPGARAARARPPPQVIPGSVALSNYDVPMQRTQFREMTCSIARSPDVAGEWWTPLILRDIWLRRNRF